MDWPVVVARSDKEINLCAARSPKRASSLRDNSLRVTKINGQSSNVSDSRLIHTTTGYSPSACDTCALTLTTHCSCFNSSRLRLERRQGLLERLCVGLFLLLALPTLLPVNAVMQSQQASEDHPTIISHLIQQTARQTLHSPAKLQIKVPFEQMHHLGPDTRP
jgi:hypothetical protein